MSRGRPSRFGRASAVPPVSFRVSGPQRSELETAARAAGVTVNEMARRRATGEDGNCVTEVLGDEPGRELKVEYDG